MNPFVALARPALLVFAGLVASLLALPSTGPAAAESTMEEGAALPWRLETSLGYFELTGRSAGYLMHTRRQYDEDRERTFSVVRVSDGAVVTTFERPFTIPSLEAPELGDHSYLEMVPRSGSSYGPARLDIHSLVTGATTSIDLSSHGRYVHGDDEWALVGDPGATTGAQLLSFVFRDGGTTPVTSLVAGNDVTWVGGDTKTAYVTTNGRSYALAAATGAATQLTLPDGSPLHLWAVTDDTLIARTDTYVDGQPGYRFTIVNRYTGQVTGEADVVRDFRVRHYLPYGDGVAAVYLPDGGTLYRYQLRPVDMTSGALLPAVASDVVDADPMGNGQVALTLGDEPTGRLAVVPAATGGIQPVTDLPAIGYGAMDVGLSGGTVVTSFQGQPGLWSAPADGTGPWQPTYPDSTPEDHREASFTFAGHTVLTQLPVTRSWDPRHYRLAWPGGRRDLDAAGTPWLASHGQYVARAVPGSPRVWEVQEVRTGRVVTSWTDTTGRYLDGSWLWTAPSADGVMTGIDLTGSEPSRTAAVPRTCSGGPMPVTAVRGRWALGHCDGYSVIDLWGVMEPWDLPANRGYVQLGDGFVAWVDVSPATPTGRPLISLKVADLSVDHTVRTYGPLRGQSYPPGPDFAADTSGTPELVYIDTSYRVRHVHLDWLRPAPLTRADQTPPTMTRAPSLTPAIRSTGAVTMTPSWTFEDPQIPHEPPSGLETYDLRQRPYPSAPDAPWTQPAEWQLLTTAAVTTVLEPGAGRCFQARARDRNGNTSVWTEPACSYVDGAPPRLDQATGAPRLIPRTTQPVPYRFGARDDSTVTSYDVAVRSAARGRPLGSWHTRWAQTNATAVSVTARPGTEHCFRFRARDLAGNLSGWSPTRCSSLPVDDSGFRTRGPVTRGDLDIAILGTYTQLDQRGASATLTTQTGRTVALWAITGPYQGAVDVYAADRHLGRVSLHARWQRRAAIRLRAPRPWSGPVRIVAASRRPARLDAVAILR